MSKLARSILASFLVLLALLSVTTLAIWEDGRRFAEVVEEPHPLAPGGVADPGYVDSARIHWKTAEALHEYAREHRAEILSRLDEVDAR